MDALSDLLRVLRFSGGVFLDARFRAPWCILSQVTAEDCGPGVPFLAGLIAFHYVLDGQAEIRVGTEAPRRCAAGDLILIPCNDVHRVGSDLDLTPMAAEPLIRKVNDHELAHIDFGEGETLFCRFVCGYLATAYHTHPLLGSLPRLLITPMRGRPSAQWVESSFRFAAQAVADRQPGTQELLGRLAEILFVEALRSYIAALPAEAVGWLAAVRDPPLARALAALHARVAEPWTTERLAEQALLSRSAFAERFARSLGVPPMTYLTRWRMLLACKRLRETPAPIARIAAEVGYESESSFTRAFTRALGMAPGAYRRTQPPLT